MRCELCDKPAIENELRCRECKERYRPRGVDTALPSTQPVPIGYDPAFPNTAFVAPDVDQGNPPAAADHPSAPEPALASTNSGFGGGGATASYEAPASTPSYDPPSYDPPSMPDP